MQVVTILLERGATVDHQDKDGMTPLLVAAFEGHRDVCELLLEYEADVDHCDVTGRTPLWAAASMGHGSVVALLLFWGCYVDSIDNEGRTVLSVAAAQGGTDVVKQLLDRGIYIMKKITFSFMKIYVPLRLILQCISWILEIHSLYLGGFSSHSVFIISYQLKKFGEPVNVGV